MHPTQPPDRQQADKPHKRSTLAPERRVATAFAAVILAADIALIATGTGALAIQIIALIVAGLLALRAAGLRRASAEVSPTDGAVRADTEFEIDQPGER
ncbi:MAG: hypothetical protein H0V12_06280 [Chloroflexi bacterium]|jgi:hypothetical protein|nr:hypothetical protein [Chloroflexota bacterium]